LGGNPRRGGGTPTLRGVNKCPREDRYTERGGGGWGGRGGTKWHSHFGFQGGGGVGGGAPRPRGGPPTPIPPPRATPPILGCRRRHGMLDVDASRFGGGGQFSVTVLIGPLPTDSLAARGPRWGVRAVLLGCDTGPPTGTKHTTWNRGR